MAPLFGATGTMNPLSEVRIVLIQTTHPGNIGAAARAMKNMGLEDLVLVAPRDFPSAEATARASGADDLLKRASVVDRLEDALSDRELIVGASARRRSIPWPELEPREAAGRILETGFKTAILFGREQTGLTNEELECCHYLLHIPSNPEYSSLNVAQALQVVAYELFLQSRQPHSEAVIHASEERPACANDMASYHDHLERVLRTVGFLHPTKHEESIQRRLRRIYNRAAPSVEELHLLRGILTRIERKVSSQDPKP